mgnify:FL=1
MHMSDLDEYRQQINHIDEQMLKLFAERMQVVKKIGLYKLENHLPIDNQQRENENMKRIAEMIETDSVRKYARSWYRHMMELAKRYQKDLQQKEGGGA